MARQCLFSRLILYVNRVGMTMLYMCIEYHIYVNMHHMSAQGVDERMLNVHYYKCTLLLVLLMIICRPARFGGTEGGGWRCEEVGVCVCVCVGGGGGSFSLF